jgi:predicted amidohydrolase
MEDLKVTLVQPDIKWKDINGNLESYSRMLTGMSPTDLILFPEMFQTGFCTEPEEVAETMNGDTVRWMKRTAETYDCAVAGSLIIRENRRFFNRLIFIDQYENLTWYDKRHLFTVESEESKFTAGLSRLIVPLKGWQISFQICYDIRFPVWARNRGDYDILVNVASWPSNRKDVWDILLRARAMENQSYVLGVNRIGSDGNRIDYTGNSVVLDPKGKTIGELQESHEGLISVTLSWDNLNKFRNDFPVWKDQDNFEITA